MGIALLLKKFGFFAILARRNIADLDPPQIERRRVPASLEPHEVRGGKPQGVVDHPHTQSPLFRYGRSGRQKLSWRIGCRLQRPRIFSSLP